MFSTEKIDKQWLKWRERKEREERALEKEVLRKESEEGKEIAGSDDEEPEIVEAMSKLTTYYFTKEKVHSYFYNDLGMHGY